MFHPVNVRCIKTTETINMKNEQKLKPCYEKESAGAMCVKRKSFGAGAVSILRQLRSPGAISAIICDCLNSFPCSLEQKIIIFFEGIRIL